MRVQKFSLIQSIVTLSKSYNSVEVIKVYKPSKCQWETLVGSISKTNLNTKVNLKYHVTLSRKSHSQGHKWRSQFSRSHQGL